MTEGREQGPGSECAEQLAGRPTELEAAEAALRESEERYRRLVELLPMAVAVHRAGKIVYINPAGVALMRAGSAAELVGKPVADFLHPSSREQALARIRDALASGRNPPLAVERFVDCAGDPIDVEVTAMPMAFDGAPAMMVLFRDVTELERAEAEKAKLERQMQHVQKLESLGVLAGGIAHDFNNLLMAILGNLDLALADLSPASPARQNLLAAENASRRAADLARQMLAYSGRGRFRVERVGLNEVIGEMAHMLEVSVSKKAHLRFDLARDLPPVEADVAQLTQVVMNLVLNAAEAIGDAAGAIAITTGAARCTREELKRAWLDENLPEGTYVVLEVEDTGCGMDAATVARVFDPFFTTKFTGRGLGLAAVLGIVRGHKGAIEVHSAPGKGSRFRVLLPAAPPASAAPGPSADPGAWRGSGTVLLVDDEEAVRAVGARMLERLGYAPVTAADGPAAVTTLGELLALDGPESIACAIVDLTMPRMDGVETGRALRAVCPGLRVILSSGYSEQEVDERFPDAALAGFIQKPYELKTLGAALRALDDGVER